MTSPASVCIVLLLYSDQYWWSTATCAAALTKATRKDWINWETKDLRQNNAKQKKANVCVCVCIVYMYVVLCGTQELTDVIQS